MRREWLAGLGVGSVIAFCGAAGVSCFTSSTHSQAAGGDAAPPPEDAEVDSAPAADAGTDARVDATAASDSGPTVDAATAEASVDSAPDAPVDAAPHSAFVPPSCAPGGLGMTNCGASDGGESCCASLEVTGGTYYRTYNTAESTSGPPDGGWTDEADPATVSGLRLDKYLVTVGRFRQFVNAVLPPDGGAGWMPAASSGIHTLLYGGLGLVSAGATNADGGVAYETGWDAVDWNNTTDIDPTTANLTSCSPYSTWTATAGSQENLPINCVNWWESYAFCIWDGGFLPSEAEWEYAAAGGSEQLEYPWGSTAPAAACPGTGCAYAIYGCNYPSGSGSCSGVTNIAPVGTATLGAGRWGQLDLAGEFYEWNLDFYAPYVDPCTDCAYLTAAANRLVVGGNFIDPAMYLVPPYRHNYIPTRRDRTYGLRCSRTP